MRKLTRVLYSALAVVFIFASYSGAWGQEGLETRPDNEQTVNWLKSNPEAAKKAFANREWLEDHPNVVRGL